MLPSPGTSDAPSWHWHPRVSQTASDEATAEDAALALSLTRMLLALSLSTAALQRPAVQHRATRQLTPGAAAPFATCLARSAPVIMKRPWYLPEKEEKGDKWQPGDEPSLKGFLAGFMVGLDGGKAKVDQKNYVAEEEEGEEAADVVAGEDEGQEQPDPRE